MGSNDFRGQTPIKVALADQKIIKVFRTDNLNSHFRELAKIPIKVEAIKRVFANYPTHMLDPLFFSSASGTPWLSQTPLNTDIIFYYNFGWLILPPVNNHPKNAQPNPFLIYL
jgi:hypothetical protein